MTTDDPTDDSRRTEIATNLRAVHERIAAACEAAGRSPDEITLTVVTKFFPVSDVEHLVSLGVTDVGENRHQEAEPKYATLTARAGVTLHFIGQLQSNKASAVARYVDVVESVDRAKLVRALASTTDELDRHLDVLVQISLDGETSRGGVLPDAARNLADRIALTDHLRLRGVMAVAPLGADPRPAFATLRGIADGIRADHPEASWISAGMSADLEEAVSEGATHLRVGSAILGSRLSHR